MSNMFFNMMILQIKCLERNFLGESNKVCKLNICIIKQRPQVWFEKFNCIVPLVSSVVHSIHLYSLSASLEDIFF